jgi:hypothetical protein
VHHVSLIALPFAPIFLEQWQSFHADAFYITFLRTAQDILACNAVPIILLSSFMKYIV